MEQVAEHIQRYFHVFPDVSDAMVPTDGHHNVWSGQCCIRTHTQSFTTIKLTKPSNMTRCPATECAVVNDNIDTQQTRHQNIISPAAELTSPSQTVVQSAELWTSAASPYILRGHPVCTDDSSWRYSMYTCADLPPTMCGTGTSTSSCPVRCGSCARQPQTEGSTAANTIDVSEGALLSIEPGVRVLVSNGGGIHVSGGLLAAGEPHASIEFGSLLDSADCQRWGGVTVTPSSHGVLLRHVWLVGATTALTVTGPSTDSPIVIEKCAFDDWEVAAVVYEGADSLVLRQSSFGLGPRAVQTGNASPRAIVGNGDSRAVIEHCVFDAFRGAGAQGNRQPDMASVIIDHGQPVLRSNTFLRDAINCDDGSSALRINEVVVGVPPILVAAALQIIFRAAAY